MENLVKNLKAKLIENVKKSDAKDQLLMFVTGRARAMKSTEIEVAQQHYFECYRSMDNILGEKTFHITTITSCASTPFGGTILQSAAFLNSKSKIISDKIMEI